LFADVAIFDPNVLTDPVIDFVPARSFMDRVPPRRKHVDFVPSRSFRDTVPRRTTAMRSHA
jgi:hypothetical protein